MPSRRILTQGESDEPLWMQLCTTQLYDAWAAMILADEEQPPEAGQMCGLAFFGTIKEEAEGKDAHQQYPA